MMTASAQEYARSDRGGVGPGVTLPKLARTARSDRGTDAAPADDPFAQLARLVASNDRLAAQLKFFDAQLAYVDGYLAEGPPNFKVAQARRNLLRTYRSRVLAQLRANRIEAREFLSR